MSYEISDQVARAIDLGARAQYRGAPPDDKRPLYSLEGHAKRGRFLFHCRGGLIPFLIRDIEAAAAKSSISQFRMLCGEAVATLRAEFAKPIPVDRSYIWSMRNPDGTTANGG